MANGSVLEKIEKAAAEGLEVLNLSGCGLTALPPEIGNLTRLTSLYLGHNQLTFLPPELGALKQLTTLSVRDNQLTALPPEIGALTRLTLLDVRDNQLTALPPEIGALTQLDRLFVHRNQLTALPPEIGALARLTLLVVGDNRLTALPPEIGKLTELRELNVVINQLTALPPEMGALTQLRLLAVHNNQLAVPPPEIVEQGTAAILAYLRDLGVAEEPNWRSKILVVGEAAVGKTSLIKVMRGGTFDPDEKQTHGILIGELPLQHPGHDDVEMRLACWDFGGQEIYRATHQFFLSEESLYILIWRPRRGDVESRIVQWLTAIHTRAPGSPVLVVANQFEGDSPPDLDDDQLETDFPAIAGFFQVNAATADGVPELVEAVRDTAQGLPMMGQMWPRTWHEAAEAIRQQDAQYLSATSFERLLKKNGIDHKDSRAALTGALHRLGDILYFQDDAELEDQVFLKPKWVSDLIVRAIESKEVVDSDGVLTREHSKELWADVDDHIRDHLVRLMERFDLSYRTPDRREISLVVDAVPKSRPPDHASEFQAAASRPGSRTIRLSYRFQTLPAGVPTWFIARAHRFTTHTHWRTGAVFADDPGHTHMALVTASEADRSVELEVCGPQPAYFLGVLRRQFEDTLRRYPGLTPEITIPCPGHDGAPCSHEFDFRLLQKRLERSRPRYIVECDVAAANEDIDDPDIDIRQLLYGLHPSTMDMVSEDLRVLKRRAETGHAEVMSVLRSLSQQVTHNHMIQWRARQSELNSICPAVFVIRQQNRSTARDALFGYRWKLYLYCEAPGSWHQMSHEGYLIKDMPKWLRSVEPYLGPLIKGLQAVAPFVAPVTGLISPESAKALENDLRLMQEVVKKLPQIRDDDPGRDFDKHGREDPERSQGAALQALHAFLREHAPEGPWGGLSKVLTPEGDYLWLCEEHARKLAR